jgi:hypothetical protein
LIYLPETISADCFLQTDKKLHEQPRVLEKCLHSSILY